VISIKPVRPDFVAEIGNVDLTHPISEALFREIEAAFEKYAVLIFHGNHCPKINKTRLQISSALSGGRQRHSGLPILIDLLVRNLQTYRTLMSVVPCSQKVM